MSKSIIIKAILLLSIQTSLCAFNDKDAIQFCADHKNSYLITLWPSIASKKEVEGIPAIDYIEKKISRVAKIVYAKQLNLNKTGAYFFIEAMYEKERRFRKFSIEEYYAFVRTKIKAAFGKQSLVHVYVVTANDIEELLELKRSLRSKLSLNMIHVPDTHEEAVVLSQFIFARNTEDILNSSKIE